jgi:rhamnopyranosyl-N-acetylglucosaminyl-diphospho-decaprenol beta-1,3/1,4-galactofuranosyltransferase
MGERPASDGPPRLHGVLVTFRRPQALTATLGRLEAQSRRLDRLVVVDNAPSPAGRDAVDAHPRAASETRYVAAPENLGPAGGIALGMRALLEDGGDRDWAVLLDDDDPPEEDDGLARLEGFGQAMLEADPRTGGVGLTGARFDWRRGRPVRMADRDLAGPVPVDYVGGNQLPTYRVEVVRAVGPFRDELFFGFDDLEFGLRLRRAGYSLYVDGDRWRERRAARGRMGLESGPSLQLAELSWRRYYSLRNVVWILRSHGRSGAALRVAGQAGLGKPLLHLARAPRPALAHLRLNARACLDGWRGRMGRTLEPDAGPASVEVSSGGR